MKATSFRLTILLLIVLAGSACQHDPRTPDEWVAEAETLWKADQKQEALHLYRKAAEKGHAMAQVALGNYFCYGHVHIVVFQDREKTCSTNADIPLAETWYDKAIASLTNGVEAGDAEAQYHLGMLYYSGDGVDKSLEEARRLWLLAAEQDYALAHFYLGMVSRHEENREEAFQWYQSAAELGYLPAYDRIVGAYLLGRGVPQNTVKAFEALHTAIAKGSDEAQAGLENLLDGIRKGAADGVEESQRYLDELEAAGLLPAEDPASS